MRFAKAGKRKQAGRISGGAVALCASVFAMTLSNPAHASQNPRPVVSVSCDSDMELCRALVQALAEIAPRNIYRINPDPMPPQAFDLRLEMSGDQTARLHWQEGGQGTAVTRTGLSETDLARHLVVASPGLARAMGARP